MSNQTYPYTFYPAGVKPSFDGYAPFANPFVDVASSTMPTSVTAMLRHAEDLANTNETFREALKKVAAYFVTDVVVDGELGADEKQRQVDYLKEDIKIISNLVEAAISHLVYGNQYTSIIQPIARYLVCPKCSTQYRIGDVAERPDFKLRLEGVFKGVCASCGHDGHMGGGPDGGPLDMPDESRPPIFKSWNPHDIRVRYNESLGQTVEYIWIIPAEVRTEAKMAGMPGGNKSIWVETPWAHLQACLRDENVKFPATYIHHWREPRLAGMRFQGIGVPRAIINYRQLYHTQILRRMNEVLALGHVVPIRVISPGTTNGRGPEDGDVLKTTFLGDVRARVTQIIANHRADPSSIHYSPIALQMQALGADARQLISADILNQAQEVLLNGSGVPVEFYRTSMQTQTAPVGLRLIERYWSPLVDGMNELLVFVGRRLQFLKKWEKAKYKLASVRLVDSIELNQLRVQMAQAGLLSRSKALEAVEANFVEETRQKLEDMRTEQTAQADFQQEADAFSFSRQLSEAVPMGGVAQAGPQGQPGQPGAPAQGDPNAQAGAAGPGVPAGSDPLAGVMPQQGVAIDPQELDSRATAAAQVLLQLPEGVRFGKMQDIKQGNPQFHALVKAKMEEQRSSARSQGQAMMMQQQGFQ